VRHDEGKRRSHRARRYEERGEEHDEAEQEEGFSLSHEERVQGCEERFRGVERERTGETEHRHHGFEDCVREERIPHTCGPSPSERGAEPEPAEKRGDDRRDSVDGIPEQEREVLGPDHLEQESRGARCEET
jgi:hypothetical protein